MSHLSLTHTFKCPKCGGTFFRSSCVDGEKNRKYICRDQNCRDESCDWRGTAEQCFTVKRDENETN
jgi:hypothetical protein